MTALEGGRDVVGDTDWFMQQDIKARNTLMAGIVQNFEFVYELGTKMLRRRPGLPCRLAA